MPSIRAATEDDATSILALRKASIRAFGPERYHAEQVDAWAAQPLGTAPYLDSIRDESELVIVAEEDDDIAGFGRVELDTGVLSAVYVHPEYARDGVGSSLLSHLESEARNEGLGSLSLHASLNATDFYETNGYERVETVEHEAVGGVELACVEMMCEL